MSNVSKSTRVSYAQERLWFLDQLESGNTACNIPAAYRLEGSLDVDALEWSLNEIVQRHEVLRTTFEAVDGRPVQVIAPELSLTLPVEDLRRFPESEREVEVRRLAAEEARRPFDLADGPLLRARLLRLGEACPEREPEVRCRREEHVLLLTMHHIVSDGWSMGVFNRELSALYEAFCEGESSPLPELSTQYADFAVWQGEVLEEQLACWRQHLDGAFVRILAQAGIVGGQVKQVKGADPLTAQQMAYDDVHRVDIIGALGHRERAIGRGFVRGLSFATRLG